MFPGNCVRCGGPQWWTVTHDDVIWIRCQDEACQDDQLVLPLLDSELERTGLNPELEPSREGGVVPLEGGATEEKEGSVLTHIGVPLEAVLLNLWEGGVLYGE